MTGRHPPRSLSGNRPARQTRQDLLICFIDDASRVVPHGAFYDADDTPNLIDCFQTALDKRGVPTAVYVDNGSNYSSKEFATICTRLGTVLIHTPVRDGAAKGKIERFFRTVRDEFLTRNLSHIRYLRHTGFPPTVYQDGVRLGDATLLDPVANDRRPDIEF